MLIRFDQGMSFSWKKIAYHPLQTLRTDFNNFKRAQVFYHHIVQLLVEVADEHGKDLLVATRCTFINV